MDIIERKIGYTDKMMLKDLEISYKVLTQSVTKMVGRGKNRHAVEIKKYDVPRETLELFKRSIDYYG